MKSGSRKSNRINKGAPSGFVISLVVHVAAFFIAGLFVVFTVVNKPEPEFEAPPPVERPKMKLKKPKVKVRKSSQPKPSSRIVAKVKTRDMPEIQLPDLMGSGEGLLGGIGLGEGEVMDLPDINTIRLMGTSISSGSDFVGSYYDFNRRRNGSLFPMDRDDYMTVLLKFFNSDWDTALISKYYRSPNKRYATCFMVPEIPSDLAPEAFGEPGAPGYCWGILYQGKLVHTRDIKFRFWGFGDDVLMVRVDGRLVLAASYPGQPVQEGCGWTSSSSQSGKYMLGGRESVVGDWITLEAGVPIDMEVFIGECPGGSFCAQLLVEVEGEEYETNNQGGPVLPMFSTEVPSLETLDAIYEHLVRGEASLTNGPVFSDFETAARRQVTPGTHIEKTRAEADGPRILRTWTLLSGKTIDASYEKKIMDTVWFINAAGERIKVPLTALSDADQGSIELLNPPRLDMEFHSKEDHLQGYYKGNPYLNETIPPTAISYSFEASFRSVGSVPYRHELKVTYYAIGRQLLDRDKYVLLEKKTGSWRPSENAEITLSGSNIKMLKYNFRNQNRGRDYANYLLVVTDERGEIIAHKESADWLFKHLDELDKLPIGAFMDDSCARVHPTGPNPQY